jgi:adenylate cyclase
MRERHALENWRPLKFEPDVERAYALHMLERIVPLGRLAYCFGIAAFSLYQFWDLLLDPLALARTGPIRLVAVLNFVVCGALTFLPAVRTNPRVWPALNLYTYCAYGFLFFLILARLPGGFVAGVGGLPLGAIFVPALTNGVRQASEILVAFLVVSLVSMALLGGTTFELANALAWAAGGVGFAVGLAYLLDVMNRQAFHLGRLLDSEKQRSEALLLNILPVDIAARLKAREEPLADSHENVSVLFADLAGFTSISRKMSAADLVGLLNDLFSRFDKLVQQHGAEKIKTIGDAYMVAVGLNGSVAGHAEKIADLALGMQQAFGAFRRDNKVDLKLRIGVHSGAVIAGVIGKQKFSYDLWGDTVNLASRMESEGVPDRIQISAETWEMLSDRYRTSPRGEIRIKGHRPRATYFLEGCA